MKVSRWVLATAVLLAPAIAAQNAAERAPAPPAPSYAETMEVTASRSEQPLLDSPVALSVLGERQIEQSPADNYADLLRGVPGVNVVQTSTRDLSVRSRGATRVAENSQVAMVDGRSVYLDYYGIVVWDYLPIDLSEVKSIEILRGPGSAVWGPNAMSGVINVLTKTPRELTGATLTLKAGERGTRAASAIWGQTRGALSYKLSGSLYEQDPWPRDDRLPDGTPLPFGYTYENEGTRQPKADGRLDLDLSGTAVLSVRAGYGGTTGIFHSNIGPFAIQPGAHVVYGEVEYTRGSTDAKAYVNRLNGDGPNLLIGLPFSFEMNTYVAEATHRRAVGKRHLLVFGVAGRANRFDINLAPNRSDRNDAGVFIEDIFAVSRALEINAGLRLDYFDALGTVPSPRLSVIVKPTDAQAIRLAANRAYRAPTLLEQFLETAVPNVLVLPSGQPVFFYSQAVGNPELERESIDALELGYSARYRNFYVDAAVYRNTIEDNTAFFPSEFYSAADPPAGWPLPPSAVPPFALPKTFTFFNVGRVRMEGLELSGEVRPRLSTTLRASYTYQRDPRVENDHPLIPLVVNRPPRHMGSVSGEYRRERWFGSASVSYTGRAFWADVLDQRFWGYSDASTIVSAAAGMEVRRNGEVSLEGTNLLDRRVKQHVFGDVIGRKVAIQLRYRIR